MDFGGAGLNAGGLLHLSVVKFQFRIRDQ
jgi:hypothetical protein